VRGRVAPGSGAQKGVGSPSRRLFRAAPAGTPPPYLAAAAAPKGEGTRPPSRRPPPKHLQGRRRGPKTPYKRRYREAEEIFFGRWVFNIGRWVFKDLGVGCSTTDFGRWVFNIGRWVFKDLGVGCVGCLWRGRWVFSEGPERRQRGGSTSTAPAPQPGRQQGPLDLERSTVGVQVTWDPEVCGRFVGIGSHFHQQPTPKKGRRR
jgi:hypothetical protein